MIYLDSSVALAHLLFEDHRSPASLWTNTLISSRLTEYEVWCRLHARGLASSHGEPARQLLGRISFVELSPLVLERALEPFPAPVSTLDALHLGSIEFLRGRRLDLRLATYNRTPARPRPGNGGAAGPGGLSASTRWRPLLPGVRLAPIACNQPA